MTVSSQINKLIFLGDGANKTFVFPFPGVAAADIGVYYTDATGTISLLSPSLYTLVLNPAIAPNPTGIGGTVTYPLSGSAIAIGTFLTILRTLPLTQPTSLANQGTLYQPVLESMDDQQTMQLQQLFELLGRQITVAISDPTPSALPPAAQRAGLAFMFDSSGNPIAAAPGGANSPVSSAMAPVVNAASIAAAVALLGLTGVTAEPTGVMKAWAGTSSATPPAGYLLCGGQAVSRTGANAALFALVGTTFGVGDGSTTFNVPDMRGRVPAGLDNINGIAANRLTALSITSGGGSTTLGGNGGLETHTLLVAELPASPPSGTIGGSQATANVGIVSANDSQVGGAFPRVGPATVTINGSNFTFTGANLGSGTPHVIVQPTICLNWIIKL